MNDVLGNNFVNIEFQECLQVSDFPNICRVCLSPSCLHSIFKFKDEFRRTPQDLSGKMRKCSKIKAKSGDGLPDKICERCISILKLALQFRTLSENTNKRLREALKRDKSLQKSGGNTLEIDFPRVQKKRKKINRRTLHLLKEIPLIEESDQTSLIDDVNSEIKTECETEPCNVKSEEQHSPSNEVASEEYKLDAEEGDTLGMEDGDPELDLAYYDCLVCGEERRFPSRDSLLIHMSLQHGKQEALKCKKNLSKNGRNTLKIHFPEVEKKLKKSGRRTLNLLKSDGTSLIDAIKSEIIIECGTEPRNVKSEEQHSISDKVAPEKCNLDECAGDTLDIEDGDPGEDLTYYGCLVCGGERRFPSKDSLVAHMALQHGKHQDYRCHGCDQVFDTRRLRLQHEKKDCPKMPPGSHYMCRKCPAELRTRPALEVHLAQHEGGAPSTVELGALHACPICRKTLSNKGSLCTHMRLVHMQTPTIPCPICNKTMKSEYSLHSHMRTHAEPMHACDQCSYRTNLRQSLVLHKRRHSGERPYACEWCAHRSVNISNLNKHQLIHTGVRKHECAECGKKYKAKKTLVSHISSFHRGLRPFCCDKCGNKYARHKTMRAHQKKAHPDD